MNKNKISFSVNRKAVWEDGYKNGCRKGYLLAVEDFEKMIDKIDTQYPDDDGEPFEVLACNYVKELKQQLQELGGI